MTLFDLLAAATPTPTPTALNEDAVTPGWIGFVAIFAVALITVFLIIDMTRRVRRVRYREEVRERLAAEESASSD
jgi:hypothetical protein